MVSCIQQSGLFCLDGDYIIPVRALCQLRKCLAIKFCAHSEIVGLLYGLTKILEGNKKGDKTVIFLSGELMHIGDRIKELRGYESRKSFCDNMYIAINTLIRYEKGERIPDAEFISRLCEKYNVTADWLIFGKEPKLQQTPQSVTEHLYSAQLGVQSSPSLPMKSDWVLSLPFYSFERLWDEFREETDARRGWLQVELLKRFPEFADWAEHKTAPRAVTLKRAGMVNQMVGVMGLEDE